MTDSKDKQEGQVNDPPELSESYHKARRQLGLFSAILLSWEYIVIRLNEKPSEPVKLTIPVANNEVAIDHPEVIPIVSVALVLYFALRLGIEWKQCAVDRRVRPASQIDLLTHTFLRSHRLYYLLCSRLQTFDLPISLLL